MRNAVLGLGVSMAFLFACSSSSSGNDSSGGTPGAGGSTASSGGASSGAAGKVTSGGSTTGGAASAGAANGGAPSAGGASSSGGRTTAGAGNLAGGGQGGSANPSGGSAGKASGGSAQSGGATSSAGAAGAAIGCTSPNPGYSLVWSDEFDGPAGTQANPAYWTHDVGGDGWGNSELEYYTDGAANAALDGSGKLVITAKKESQGGRSYTSARLKTQGLKTFTYGRIEARMQIPKGQGIWPAFWLLGDDINDAHWPGCGEIDVMENIGKEPNVVHGTIHGPGYSAGEGLTATTTLTQPVAADFHVFAIEWEANAIRWYVDDTLYSTKTPSDVPSGKTWVYTHPFFIILNVAVGGGWPGDPDSSTVFPQQMSIDYVRVCQKR